MPSNYKAITKDNVTRLGTDTASRKTQVSMYSDSTHFVYEILQNADDYGATEVSFKLSQDMLVIEHNGEPFTEENVKAITYFGKSTSRDDLVKTGRFGIGFKSVFAFTATPIVISGDEHFEIYDLYRIREYHYPIGFSRLRTRIVLPFNHQSKRPDFVEKLVAQMEAYRQISKCLMTLEMDVLLFTRNIQKILWQIDNRSGSYQRQDEVDDNVRLTTITYGKHEDKYIVFSKVPTWDSQEHKAVEIAFAMDKKGQISSTEDDSLYVLFKTKEETGLRFLLNGPYRTNPARETISKDDDFNVHLIKVTCDLIEELLPKLRDRNLLTIELLSVLPNDKDELTYTYSHRSVPDKPKGFYTLLRETIINAFQNKKLTPTKCGDHAPALKLYRDRDGLSDFIHDEDLGVILGKESSMPLWVASPEVIPARYEVEQYVQYENARMQNKRINDFLTSLDILSWSIDDFINVIGTDNELVKKWLKERSYEWYQGLYVLLDEFLPSGSSYIRYEYQRKRKEKLSNLRIVPCSDGIYRAGSECFFPSDGVERDDRFPRVVKEVYSSGQSRDQKQKARKFLKDIGVREVGESVKVEAILKQQYAQSTINVRKQDYKRDLKRFIKLVEEEPDSANLFKDHFIFELDNGHWGKPESTFIDSPYRDTGLTAYYEIHDNNLISKKRPLSPAYNEFGVDLERFVQFAVVVGVQTRLQVMYSWIKGEHPEISVSADWTKFATSINRDYVIPEFEVLLASPSLEKSKLIWRTMCSQSDDCLEAKYQYNRNYPLKIGASSLVWGLRQAKWVPQKTGKFTTFVLPQNAWIEYLPEGFLFRSEQKWIKAIEFGETANQHRSKDTPKDLGEIGLDEQAKNLGFRSSDEAEKMAEVARISEERGLPVDELISRLKHQNKFDDSYQEEKSKPIFPVSSLANSERWQTRIANEFENIPRVERKAGVRTTSGSAPNAYIRVWLKANYTNDEAQLICQICELEMPFKKLDGEYHFEAIAAFTKTYFAKVYFTKMEHEALFLALCPTCAASYREFVRRDEGALVELVSQLISFDNLEIPLQLGKLSTSLRFVERHWFAIKKILKGFSGGTP